MIALLSLSYIDRQACYLHRLLHVSTMCFPSSWKMLCNMPHRKVGAGETAIPQKKPQIEPHRRRLRFISWANAGEIE